MWWIMSCNIVFTKLYSCTLVTLHICCIYLSCMLCLRLSIHVWSNKATTAIMSFDKLKMNILKLNFIFASTARQCAKRAKSLGNNTQHVNVRNCPCNHTNSNITFPLMSFYHGGPHRVCTHRNIPLLNLFCLSVSALCCWVPTSSIISFDVNVLHVIDIINILECKYDVLFSV